MSPIHNHDLILVRGEYGVKPDLPAIGGTEATGVISAAGSAVTGLKAGDRVAVADAERTWAEYFTAPADAVTRIPEGLDDRIAAQILSMPFSAALALDQFDAQQGDWIVVNAGNGAVGKVIAALGRSRGLNVALLVRREQAMLDLETQGFDNVFVTRKPGWTDALRSRISGGKVVGAVDMIGGTAAGELASLLSPKGVLLAFGAMSNDPASIDVSDLIFRQITVQGFWNYQESQTLAAAQKQAIISELLDLANSGALSLPVEQVIPLDEAARAMAASARSRVGKVLIAA